MMTYIRTVCQSTEELDQISKLSKIQNETKIQKSSLDIKTVIIFVQ